MKTINSAKELRDLRQWLGLSQYAMAVQMGMTLRGYQDLEYEKNPISEMHIRLAAYAALCVRRPTAIADLLRALEEEGP